MTTEVKVEMVTARRSVAKNLLRGGQKRGSGDGSLPAGPEP